MSQVIPVRTVDQHIDDETPATEDALSFLPVEVVPDAPPPEPPAVSDGRIEIPLSNGYRVTEGRRNHAVGLHPRLLPGLRLLAPGLEKLGLDEAQVDAYHLAVSPHHPCPGLGRRIDQHLQRYRLGGG